MAIISRVKVWVNGDLLTAPDLNSEFNNILSDYNGNITTANIASGANIPFSKLDATTVVGVAATQTITGPKTFADGQLKVAGAGAGVATLQNANTANSRTITLPDPGTNADVVTTAGAQTIAGVKSLSDDLNLAATKLLYLDGGGDTYIQEYAANQLQIVAGGAGYLLVQHTGSDATKGLYYANRPTASTQTTLTVNTSTGQITQATSSIRFKKDIENLEVDSALIFQMRPVSYTEIEDPDERRLVGFIAEEVNTLLPDLVLKDSNGTPDSIMYERLTALIIAELKKLKNRVDQLEANP